MNLNRAYQWSSLLLALLGILSYAAAAEQTAQGVPVLLVWALPALCTGWYLSATRGFVLPRAAVNALLAGALAYAALEAASHAVDVARIAELVIILLIIKVADRRTSRDDGQIISLSVFLAIAALLTGNSLIVGVLLLMLLPMLAATVMLFQLQAGWVAVHRRAAESVRAAPPRWAAVTVPRLSAWIRRTVGAACVAILATALFVFVILPRGVGENFLGNFGQVTGSGSISGFTDHVTLGDRGVISESPAVVFTAEFRRPNGGENLGSGDRVYYLRGAVLDRYDSTAHSWNTTAQTPHLLVCGDPDDYSAKVPLEIAGGGPIIEQIVHIPEVSGRQTTPLFTMWRPVSIATSRRIWIDHRKGDGTLAAVRPSNNKEVTSGPLTYTVTSVIADGAPEESRSRTPASFPAGRVHDLAVRILHDAGREPDPTLRPVDTDPDCIRTILEHLRATCTYTTVENPLGAGEDPIEHFLFTSHAGHCEYFAAAMTALCRSVGINARMIAGYLAAEYVEGSGHYIVRKSNAHAWVEAEAAPGVWRRYDPTPPADLLRLHKPAAGLMTRLRQAFDAVEFAWNKSIVGFDETDRERLWAPAGEPGRALAARLEKLTERVRYGGVRLLWVAFLRGLLVFSAVSAVGFVVLILVRLIQPSRGPRRPRDPASLRFYRRLLAALERRGLGKPAWRPPLDHAAGLSDAALSGDAASLVHLYYRARFGGTLPSVAELAGARDLLNRIRQRPRPAGPVR